MANTMQQTTATRGPLADQPSQRITPLLNIQRKTFRRGYYYGLIQALYGPEMPEEQPLPATYLIDNLKRHVEKGYFGGRHPRILARAVGFSLGMIHGAVLDAKTGTVREGVTALVRFTHPQIQSAYNVARECTFLDHHYRLGEQELREQLTERTDPLHYVPSEQDWQHTIGDILGVLSTQLFPWTSQDAQVARERLQEYEARTGYFPDAHEPGTLYYEFLHYGETEMTVA